jgi:hypothetical protein
MPPAKRRTRAAAAASRVDDDEGFDAESDLELDSIAHSRKIKFPLRATYTNWSPWEAFRELVQNW